jgi:hypothetical protein
LLDRRLAVYEEYCDARLAGGAATELIPDLRRHLAGHPFRERAWGALMRAQYRGGDVAGALASFAEAHKLLGCTLLGTAATDALDEENFCGHEVIAACWPLSHGWRRYRRCCWRGPRSRRPHVRTTRQALSVAGDWGLRQARSSQIRRLLLTLDQQFG